MCGLCLERHKRDVVARGIPKGIVRFLSLESESRPFARDIVVPTVPAR